MSFETIVILLISLAILGVIGGAFFLWASTRGRCCYCLTRTGFWKKYHPACRTNYEQSIIQEETQRKNAEQKWTQACHDYFADLITTEQVESIMETVSDILPKALMDRIADKAEQVAVVREQTKLEREYQHLLFQRTADANAVSDEDIILMRRKVINDLPIETIMKVESFAAGSMAVTVLQDDIVTDDEFSQFESFLNVLVSGPYLRGKNQIQKVFQRRLLQEVCNEDWEGAVKAAPKDLVDEISIVFQKGEIPLWRIERVSLATEKKKREYIGASAGVSFRVARGVYLRTGAFKGHPIEKTWMETKDVGDIILTNKNFYFISDLESIRIPWKKVVSISAYSDGVMIHKGTKNPVILQGFDPWFLSNFASVIHA